MIKAYKFRIYPNKEQRLQLAKTFGCVRWVWNHFLYRKEDCYKRTKEIERLLERKLRNDEKTNWGMVTFSRELTQLKKEYEWLKEPDKWALQNALRNLDKAYERFFKGIAKRPKFKRKKDECKSYTTTLANGNIKVLDQCIQLPKLGLVRYRDTRHCIEGTIVNVTISQEPSGKYYVSICCKDVPETSKAKLTGRSIGIDLGLKEFLITSDGDIVPNHKFLKQKIKKLKRLQRALSRKTKDSSRWKKNKRQIAVVWEQIRHTRLDFQHKLTSKLVNDYDIICLESLKIKNMIKNHKLAQSISDVAWGQFVELLKYKADWNNKKVIQINSYFPSSQLCSVCGYKNQETKNLSVREWTCPVCGTHHDRDINAAKNILAEGLKIA